MKMLIVARVIFKRWNPPPSAPHPHAPQGFFISAFFIVAHSLNPLLVWQAQWKWRLTREGRAHKGHGAGSCGGRITGRGEGPGLRGPGGARPPRHATAAAVFVQLALRWGRNWAAQWHLARAVGKRFRGCRAKRIYVYSEGPCYK